MPNIYVDPTLRVMSACGCRPASRCVRTFRAARQETLLADAWEAMTPGRCLLLLLALLDEPFNRFLAIVKQPSWLRWLVDAHKEVCKHSG